MKKLPAALKSHEFKAGHGKAPAHGKGHMPAHSAPGNLHADHGHVEHMGKKLHGADPYAPAHDGSE